MHTRDALGRRVSLLNDDIALGDERRLSYRPAGHFTSHSYHGSYGRSPSSSPNTPELLRSDSYDSQISNEPLSPVTPMYDYSRGYAGVADIRSHYDDFTMENPAYSNAKTVAAVAERRSSSYDEDAVTSPAAPPDRSGKRYPCRYRDSHGCEKTFTTSGHASRHSKIHTAEKAVQCTYPGCVKKFTRADNMKQHLETHYKDKSRSSSRPSLSSTERRVSSSGKSSSRSKAAAAAAASRSNQLPSPAGAWDMRELSLPLMRRPGVTRIPSSGLDALAMAVACQEGV